MNYNQFLNKSQRSSKSSSVNDFFSNQKTSSARSTFRAQIPNHFAQMQSVPGNYNLSTTVDNIQQKTRYNPYSNRHFAGTYQYPQNNFAHVSGSATPLNSTFIQSDNQDLDSNSSFYSNITNLSNETSIGSSVKDGVVLQISNLDPWYDESNLRHYLLSQLKPITPVLSLIIESPCLARVKVPSQQFAKLVVSHLHRKKFGHKRMIVSYLKDQTSAETSALRCQVAGLLKDVPTFCLKMCKFRELFQSRFKSSISVLDLYRMSDICQITLDSNDEKYISLHPALLHSNENNSLVEANQHSAPYCMHHFKALEQNKGWAELEIDPLPDVFMSIGEVQSKIFPLLKSHPDDIPIASLVYCLEGVLGTKIPTNDRGVCLEHLVGCVQGVQIKSNNYGIKVLAWLEEKDIPDNVSVTSSRMSGRSNGSNKIPANDSLSHITKEVIELIKMSPKSTMMFNKFIPAYHSHFGKQCRVADYGYTKLIELFEALSGTVQIMGDGENRLITLTHRTQIRRFTTDLLKIIRNNPSKQIQLSQLNESYLMTFNKPFNVTDYGVCDVEDLLEGLRHNNSIVVSTSKQNESEVILYIQKRKQTNFELEKTSIFAGEVVDLLRNAPQYAVLFKKFVRSYHYFLGYQCRLSDYGFSKLTELLEAITGVVEMDSISEENRRVMLSSQIALRVFSEQIQEIIKTFTESSKSMIKVDDLMNFHKTKFGYQMQAQTLGYDNIIDALKSAPYVEITNNDNELWIMSHLEDENFRQRSYMACLVVSSHNSSKMSLQKFNMEFPDKFKFHLNEKTLHDMKHAVEVEMVNGTKMISITPMFKFIMSIISILQKRSKVGVHELKNSLNVNLNTTFVFGYPNVSSLIQAFPDIFTSPSGVNMHERSDVELNKNCVFASCQVKKFSQTSSGSSSSARSNSINKYFNTFSAQKPCDVNNNKRMDSYYPTNFAPNKPGVNYLNRSADEYCLNQAACLEQCESYYSHQMKRNAAPTPLLSQNYFQNQNYQDMGAQQNFYSNQQLNTTYPPYGNGNQDYNNAYQQSQKLSERRNANNLPNLNAINLYQQQLLAQQAQQFLQAQQQQQQQAQTLQQSFNASSASNNSSSSMNTSSLNAGGNNSPNYRWLHSLYRLCDPPKPDTPPAKVLPIWLDPIWGNHPESPEIDSLNIQLPELKTYNMMPIVLTPCNVTFNNKNVFNFDENNNNAGVKVEDEKSIN